MMNNMLASTDEPTRIWKMPVLPEQYDRSPLSSEEWQALEYCESHIRAKSRSPNQSEYVLAKQRLDRLNRPVADVYYLRHPEHWHPSRWKGKNCIDAQLFMRREMYRRGKMFWDWSLDEWIDTLCPTQQQFKSRYGDRYESRASIMDLAYLLGGLLDLRSIGEGLSITAAANVYFGADLVSQQCKRLIEALIEKGYNDGPGATHTLRVCLSTLFILNRSPYLEEISEELLVSQMANNNGKVSMRQACTRVMKALQHLGILSTKPRKESVISVHVDSSGMAPEWYAWCMAWYERAVNITPAVRAQYTYSILATGRWLQECIPEVRIPEQWTEDLALRFRNDVCSFTIGQYASSRGRETGRNVKGLGQPMKAGGILRYLSAIKRFFTDLSKHPYAVGGEPARKIKFDFVPKEVFDCPDPLKKEIENVEPRDIDLRMWARLVIAAATLSQSDLPKNTSYPLSFYRALALVWVSSARRPNEIARLRLDCVRDDWDPSMLDEDDQPLEPPTIPDSIVHQVRGERTGDTPRIYFLHVPSGKNQGPFWIWIPDYVASAIDTWKRERPRSQPALFDRKDRTYVDYLFCYKDHRVGEDYINASLIPVLCKKAGTDLEDAIGRITGHRARSTRLTQLRLRGVSLEDLAEYAGHSDTKTLKKHYVRHHPLQFHRIIRDADDVSRIIEGVIDVQAAAQGLPALRWFIGYDADGEPQYCANQVYHTCPHRLDCARCGMFIGGEKAKLLHEGEQTLPITSKVPMTPVEKCLVEGDKKGMEACQQALQMVPAPKAPDINLIFNPEGLSNQELEQLAYMATVDALDKLQQALDAHEKKLEDIQQYKTGRSALVGAQKKRINLIRKLITEGEHRMRSLASHSSIQAN